MFRKIILWILVFACMGTIFFFSSQVAEDSDHVSEGFIIGIVRFFNLNDTLTETEILDIARTMNGVIRIGAHFSIYALLGFLIAWLFNAYNVAGLRLVVYSVISSVLYACSDELHQSLVPGRSAQFTDIMTDASGAFCGALSVLIILKIIKIIHSKKHTV